MWPGVSPPLGACPSQGPGSKALGAGNVDRAGVLGPWTSPAPSLQSASRGSLKLAARTAAGASMAASVTSTPATASAQLAGPGTSARAVSGRLGDPWGRPGGPSGPSRWPPSRQSVGPQQGRGQWVGGGMSAVRAPRAYCLCLGSHPEPDSARLPLSPQPVPRAPSGSAVRSAAPAGGVPPATLSPGPASAP